MAIDKRRLLLGALYFCFGAVRFAAAAAEGARDLSWSAFGIILHARWRRSLYTVFLCYWVGNIFFFVFYVCSLRLDDASFNSTSSCLSLGVCFSNFRCKSFDFKCTEVGTADHPTTKLFCTLGRAIFCSRVHATARHVSDALVLRP